MAICLLIAGLLWHYFPPQPDATTVSGPSYGMVVLVFLFVTFFSTSWGPTSWVYVSEIYPNRIREYCVSMSVAMNWVGNIAVGKFVPVAIKNVGWWLFIIFFLLNILNLIFAICFIKETKSLTLEEMDGLFGKKSLLDDEKDEKKGDIEIEHVENRTKNVVFH